MTMDLLNYDFSDSIEKQNPCMLLHTGVFILTPFKEQADITSCRPCRRPLAGHRLPVLLPDHQPIHTLLLTT